MQTAAIKLTVSGKKVRIDPKTGKTRRSTNGGNAGKGSSWISPAERLGIYIRDSYLCCYCFADTKDYPQYLRTLEHVVCRTFGGTDTADNLVTCCSSCNGKRGAKHFQEFASLESVNWVRQQIALAPKMTEAKAIIKIKTAEKKAAKAALTVVK